MPHKNTTTGEKKDEKPLRTASTGGAVRNTGSSGRRARGGGRPDG